MRQLSMGLLHSDPPTDLICSFPFTSESLLTALFAGPKPYWPLTFSLIGRTDLVHPPLEFELPRQGCNFQTQSEEEKAAKQIEELFSKSKREELNVLAMHFVESVTNPDGLPVDKLLRMFQKQIDRFEIRKPSIETDSTLFPVMLYSLSRKSRKSAANVTNIYQQSSTEDIDELLRIVRKVLETVNSLWSRYPGHDILRRIARSGDFLLSLEVDAPLINFLDALEHMMNDVREWQHKERDFGAMIGPMVTLANKFLKMRLQSWQLIFENRRQVLQEHTGRQFYLILAQLSECRLEAVPALFSAVSQLVLDSPIGVLAPTLRLVEAFALYALRLPCGRVVFSLLRNLACAYRRFVPVAESHIAAGLAPLQQRMTEYIGLQGWNSDSDKKHFIRIDSVRHQLNKYCQQNSCSAAAARAADRRLPGRDLARARGAVCWRVRARREGRRALRLLRSAAQPRIRGAAVCERGTRRRAGRQRRAAGACVGLVPVRAPAVLGGGARGRALRGGRRAAGAGAGQLGGLPPGRCAGCAGPAGRRGEPGSFGRAGAGGTGGRARGRT
jgi:hypothetical protein